MNNLTVTTAVRVCMHVCVCMCVYACGCMHVGAHFATEQ